MNLRVFDSVGELAAAGAAELVRRVETGSRVIGLSGGATPRKMYQLLGAARFRERLATHPVVWVLEDERYVPPDHEDSNSRMIEQTLFASGLPGNHRFLRFRTELGDPGETAEEFEREWHELNLDGLDVIILGMGEDGHTASLFPDSEILTVTDRIAREVWVPRLDTWRVTLTLPVLRRTRWKYVLVSGKSKRSVLTRVKNGENLPIKLVTEGQGESWWLVDRDAYEDHRG